MSSFDEVSCLCPHCNRKNFLQSKAGPCNFRRYNLASAPPEILLDLTGGHRCMWCGEEFFVIAQMQVMARTSCTNPEEEDDEADVS